MYKLEEKNNTEYTSYPAGYRKNCRIVQDNTITIVILPLQCYIQTYNLIKSIMLVTFQLLTIRLEVSMKCYIQTYILIKQIQ